MYGLWLTIKGKVLADSFVLRAQEPDTFWVGSYFSLVAAIRERLEAFIIADDVTIEDETDRWAAVSLLGGAPAGSSGAAVGHGGANAVAFSGRRTRGATTELIYPVASELEIAGMWAGRAELDAAQMERERIADGVPAVPRDVGQGDLPNEAGLDAEAISYVKGCYLGQEVMARLKSMGQVRRRLLRVRGVGAVPATLPAALFVGARQVGDVRSAIDDGAGGWIGLAMLSLMHLSAAGGVLALAAEAPAEVRLIDTP